MGSEFANRIDVELNDSMHYKVKCSRGHEEVFTLETTRYTLLFDFGVLALRSGFYREAVSNFAASLERFYEFFARVICHHQGISFEQVELAWKGVSAQSERQLGAFLFLYLSELKSAAPMIKDSQVRFRNQVVHKGYIPTKKETLDYARYMHDYMISLLEVLDSNYYASMWDVFVEERVVAVQRNPVFGVVNFQSFSCVPNVYYRYKKSVTFDDKLSDPSISSWLFP